MRTRTDRRDDNLFRGQARIEPRVWQYRSRPLERWFPSPWKRAIPRGRCSTHSLPELEKDRPKNGPLEASTSATCRSRVDRLLLADMPTPIVRDKTCSATCRKRNVVSRESLLAAFLGYSEQGMGALHLQTAQPP